MAAVSPLNALSARARSIWAKSGDGEQWLALAQHMIDAAGVAELLWENWLSARLRRELAERACSQTSRLAPSISYL